MPEAKTAAATAAPRVEPVLTAVSSLLSLPVRKTKRGNAPLYPFADLTAAGQHFGVKNKTAKQLQGAVTLANKKAWEVKKDEAGNTVFKTQDLTNPADNSITKVPTTEAELVQVKHFIAVDVDADMKAKIKGTPLEGSTAIVFRDI